MVYYLSKVKLMHRYLLGGWGSGVPGVACKAVQ